MIDLWRHAHFYFSDVREPTEEHVETREDVERGLKQYPGGPKEVTLFRWKKKTDGI